MSNYQETQVYTWVFLDWALIKIGGEVPDEHWTMNKKFLTATVTIISKKNKDQNWALIFSNYHFTSDMWTFMLF